MNTNTEYDNKRTAGAANTDESPTNYTGRDGSTGLQRVRDSQDALQDLADSDLPCAWVAEALLDAADVDGDTDAGDTD